MSSCIRKTVRAFRITKAVVTRVIFGLHGLVCVWRVTVTKDQPWYWGLVASLVLLIGETVVTLKKKEGGEWKWFCPSVFLYLASTLPAIWFLELDLLERRIRQRSLESRGQKMETKYERLPSFLGKFNFHLPPDDWVKILEQILLLVLIVGRWLLPKGEITREQLSQLLLVYIGMAADIIELFEAFKEKEVKYNKQLILIILSLWTASLIQFCFVLSAAKARKSRPSFTKQPSRSTLDENARCFSCRSEIVSIMTTIVLQDGSFLVLRMMLIFRYNVVSYTNIFFTAKNTLVNVLQVYRLLVLYAESIKLIKRQKSDPLFDDRFIIKAGILASQIAKEEERKNRKEMKHVEVQTTFSLCPNKDITDERRGLIEFPNLNAVVIENPMSTEHDNDEQCHSNINKNTDENRLKGKIRGKKVAKSKKYETVGPEIINITMVYLNPTKDIGACTEGSDCLAVDQKDTLINDSKMDQKICERFPVSPDIELSRDITPGGAAHDYAQCHTGDLTQNDWPSARKRFQEIAHGIICENKRTDKEKHICNKEDNGIAATDDLHTDQADETSKSYTTATTTTTEKCSLNKQSAGFISDEVQPVSVQEDIKAEDIALDVQPRKKTRWGWLKMRAVRRKKCSDLNQNSTEEISRDLELK